MIGAPPAGGGIQIPGRAEANGITVRSGRRHPCHGVPGSAVLCSTVDTNSVSAWETFGRISGFLREWVYSAPEVNSRPALPLV